MKNSLMVAFAASLAFVTLVAGCTPGPALNIDGRYLIIRNQSGMPEGQITYSTSSECREHLRSVYQARRSGVRSTKYRCEEFDDSKNLRYRGEFGCVACVFYVQVATKTLRECENTLDNFMHSIQNSKIRRWAGEFGITKRCREH